MEIEQISYDIIDDDETAIIDIDLSNKHSRSDSPITLSDDSGNDSEPENIEHDSDNSLTKYRKLTYRDVERSLDKYFNQDTFSSEFDILATYLKGQKNIYMQSRIISQRNLHLLSVPTMILTASNVFFAPFTIDYFWGGVVVSVINAVIVLLLSVISYLKLESATEMYAHLYNQYDKMELSLEMAGNKFIYVDNMKEHEHMIMGKIKEVEGKITDIKESHISVTYPSEVKKMFPIICHINIFSFIKKIEVYKRGLIIRFKDVKNEIRYILFTMSNVTGLGVDTGPVPEQERLKLRLERLMVTKDKIREELLHYKTAYRYIDEIFSREIKHVDNYNCYWFRPKPLSYNYSNPVIKEYLEVILSER